MTSDVHPLLLAIQRRVEAWGGRVEVCDLYEEDDLLPDSSLAPFSFSVGLNYVSKVLYLDRQSMDDQMSIVELIHEAGHLFACGEPPEGSDEWAFFGWEYKLAKELGCVEVWLQSNRNYGVSESESESEEFGDLDPKKVRDLLAKRLKVARKQGLIRRGRACCL